MVFIGRLYSNVSPVIREFPERIMFRAALRPVSLALTPICRKSLAKPASLVWSAVQPTWGMAAPAAVRNFATGKKPKMEDGTLEGRYATALFMATSDKLGQVYNDLVAIRTMMEESSDFKLLIETPGIDPESKLNALEDVSSQAKLDPAVMNFLKVLIENKRMYLLVRMIDMYETFYRAEMGLVVCKVTSSEQLSDSQKMTVKAAMENRAEPGSTLIMEHSINPALLGGLVVKMGEAVFDYSVSARLDRLQTQLLAPLA